MSDRKNVYFGLTYYHIVYAILHSQYSNKSSRIYVSIDYLKMSDDFYERLKKSGFFTEVIFFSEMDLRSDLFSFLEKETNINVAGPVLEEKIREYFKNIINIYTDEDVYVFNMKQLFYGYLDFITDKIILIEDGYRSINQQITSHRFKGRFNLLEKYSGKYFPSTKIESGKIEKIIVNNISDLDGQNLEIEIEELNYVNMINNLDNDKLNELLKVFDVNKMEFDENIVLVLTQPLARAEYCTLLDQYLLYRKVIRELSKEGYKIVIKIHPADKNIYKALMNDNIDIIDNPYPVDLLLTENNNIKKVVSYGSTANGIIEDKAECIKIFDKDKFQYSDVNKHINNYIRNEKLNVLFTGKCNIKNEVLKKAKRRNPKFNFEVYNTETFKQSKKYMLDNEIDYFCYDELGIDYDINFFDNLYRHCQRNIVEVYESKCVYKLNGLKYTQISDVYRNNLKFSFFNKFIRSNIDIKDCSIEAIQSMLLDVEYISNMSKTKVELDYDIAKQLFISDDKIKELKSKYSEDNLEQKTLRKLYQNININKISDELTCNIDVGRINNEIYINSLSQDELADLMNTASVSFISSKENKRSKLNTVKVGLRLPYGKIKHIKRIAKRVILKKN